MIIIRLKSDQGDIADLAKVVVSVFPNRPVTGRATIDIELLRCSDHTILAGVGSTNASFLEPTSLPYTDKNETLESYLGPEFRRINTDHHLDCTAGKMHLVQHCPIRITDVSENNGRAVRLSPAISCTDLGETNTIEVDGESVVAEKVAGSWLRIEADWPDADADGSEKQMGITVEAEQIRCGGLYIWCIAPDSYQFSSGEIEQRNGSQVVGPHRLSFQYPESRQFAEFAIWKGWVIGHCVTRNARHIAWDSDQCAAVLHVNAMSPARRARANRRSFLTGAWIAILASAAVQLFAIIFGEAGDTVPTWVFIVLLCAVMMVLGLMMAPSSIKRPVTGLYGRMSTWFQRAVRSYLSPS